MVDHGPVAPNMEPFPPLAANGNDVMQYVYMLYCNVMYCNVTVVQCYEMQCNVMLLP